MIPRLNHLTVLMNRRAWDEWENDENSQKEVKLERDVFKCQEGPECQKNAKCSSERKQKQLTWSKYRP